MVSKKVEQIVDHLITDTHKMIYEMIYLNDIMHMSTSC